MYSAQEVAETIVQTCEQKHGKRSLHGILSGCGLPYIVDTLKKGSMPSVDKLAMIADALDCSVDYLLGRSDRVSTDLPSETSDAPQISAYEQRLLDAYRELSVEDKMYFLGRVEEAARQEQKKEA